MNLHLEFLLEIYLSLIVYFSRNRKMKEGCFKGKHLFVHHRMMGFQGSLYCTELGLKLIDFPIDLILMKKFF